MFFWGKWRTDTHTKIRAIFPIKVICFMVLSHDRDWFDLWNPLYSGGPSQAVKVMAAISYDPEPEQAPSHIWGVSIWKLKRFPLLVPFCCNNPLNVVMGPITCFPACKKRVSLPGPGPAWREQTQARPAPGQTRDQAHQEACSCSLECVSASILAFLKVCMKLYW